MSKSNQKATKVIPATKNQVKFSTLDGKKPKVEASTQTLNHEESPVSLSERIWNSKEEVESDAHNIRQGEGLYQNRLICPERVACPDKSNLDNFQGQVRTSPMGLKNIMRNEEIGNKESGNKEIKEKEKRKTKKKVPKYESSDSDDDGDKYKGAKKVVIIHHHHNHYY